MAAALPRLPRPADAASHEAVGSLSVCDTHAALELTLVLDGLDAHRTR